MALVGLMQTLGIEGRKNNIRVNCLAPTGATRMMEGLMSPEVLARLAPEMVSPAVLALVSDDAPDRTILCAGAGSVEQAHVTLTRGIHVGGDADAAERILAQLGSIADRQDEIVPAEAFEQSRVELAKAGHRVAVEPSG